MKLSQEQQDALGNLGWKPEDIQADIEDKAQLAGEAQLESKDAEEDVAAEEMEAAAETEETPTEAADYVSRQEVIDLVQAISGTVSQLHEGQKALVAQIKALQRSDDEKFKAQLALTPAASLTDQFKSAVGDSDARLHGNNRLAKDGPTETETAGPTHIGFINRLISADRNGR